MWKRITGIVCSALALSLAFSMVSCGYIDGIKDMLGQGNSELTDLEQTETQLPDYSGIECKSSTGYKFSYFQFDDSDRSILSLAFPTEWSLSQGESGYDISRDGEKIGELCLGEVSAQAGETVCFNETGTNDGIVYDWSIIHRGGEFFHRVVYSCEIEGVERKTTLEVGYAELNEFCMKRARFSISIKETSTDPGMGIIKLSDKAKNKPILILGNSFIGSSDVGEILDVMCTAGGKHEVIGVSVGMATVSENWQEYVADMRAGYFAAVFMCGFYSTYDVPAFETFVNACKASGTPIAIFPAHNETSDELAVKAYPDVYFVNWKGEINALITDGVDRWDMCVDDYHKHSTPMAGYVGAHMIYRALYGEIPPVVSQYGSLYHSDVTKTLGEYYVKTGTVPLIKSNVTIYKMY